MTVESVESEFTIKISQEEVNTLFAALITLQDRVSDIEEPVIEMGISTSTQMLTDKVGAIGTDDTIKVSKNSIREINNILLQLWKNQKKASTSKS